MCADSSNGLSTLSVEERLGDISINENASVQDIIAITASVKGSHPYGACVDKHTSNFYDECKRITFNDAGCVVIEPNGNITSVARKPDVAIPNFSKFVLFEAVSRGGDRLDCYNINGVLPSYYCKGGFVPICRVAFDPEYAPPDWNYDKLGRPDIVFMAYCGDLPDVMREKYSTGYKAFSEYDYEEIPLFSGPNGYEEARSYRDEIISRKSFPNAHRISFTLSKLLSYIIRVLTIFLLCAWIYIGVYKGF